ncbi:hypothetical protein FNSP10_01560 [Fusobacterium nucleatum]|nr:hypothetical protein FNSP10_01560 [Fusobacterium nucleatum]
MSNNLYKVEKDLRSIAKRYKSIKYSVGLAILFLMLGTGAFSEEVNNVQASEVPTREEIASSRENLKNSVGSLQAKIDQARAENEKGLAGLRLELIQLMEQGDQVVKSPWSSWQFGANYMYSKWNGTYKGRGDKAQKYPFEGVFTRSTNPFERYTSPESSNYGLLSTSANPYSATTSSRNGLSSGYGIASTTPKQEPLTVMNVDASIRPKDVYRDPVAAPTVNVSAPVLQALNVPNLLPPSLDIKTPDAIQAPNKTPQITVNPTVEFSFNSRNVLDEPWANHAAFANQDGKGLNYYSGWKPGGTGPVDEAVYYRVGNSLGPSRTRISNVFYMNTIDRTPLSIKWKLIDAIVDVAGKPGWSPMGTSAIHTVWNGTIEKVTGNLHGYSAFVSSETWHSGQVDLVNVNVNVSGQYNSIFYGYPSSYYSIGFNNGDYNSWRQRGR